MMNDRTMEEKANEVCEVPLLVLEMYERNKAILDEVAELLECSPHQVMKSIRLLQRRIDSLEEDLRMWRDDDKPIGINL